MGSSEELDFERLQVCMLACCLASGMDVQPPQLFMIHYGKPIS